jgi:Rrf2 family iron-sulfur cluster assembly transcriptional regulator
LKLSKRARYALRMMVEIARQSNKDTAVSLSQVSKSTHISRRYLEQLAIALKNASLVRGVMGKGGGYNLTRPSRTIKIGQIIEAAIGPISIVDCVLEPDNCIKSDTCNCRWVYGTINQRILGILNELSLEDLTMDPMTGFGSPVDWQGSGCSTRNILR